MSQRAHVKLPVSKKWLVDGFCWYTQRMVSKQFISLGVQKELLEAQRIDDNSPIIAYANHASWWDPIAAMLMQRRYAAPDDLIPALQIFKHWLGGAGAADQALYSCAIYAHKRHVSIRQRTSRRPQRP